jgi:hypothetical protein
MLEPERNPWHLVAAMILIRRQTKSSIRKLNGVSHLPDADPANACRGGGAWQFEMEGFSPVPRVQIVTIADALALRDRALILPARRNDTFKKAAREEVREQRVMDL